MGSRLSYTCFEILDGPEKVIIDDIVHGLKAGKIYPIDIEVGKDQASGFVDAWDPLDMDLEPHKVDFDPLVLFSYRTDKIKVPSATLKLHVRRRVAENLKATRRERLPAAEKRELAEQVHLDLMRKTPATITAAMVSWDKNSSRIRVSSTSSATLEGCLTHLRDHLGIKVREASIPSVLERNLTAQEVWQALHLIPCSFTMEMQDKGEKAKPMDPAWAPDSMSLADRIRRTAFLGREFLTWMLIRSSTDDGVYEGSGGVYAIFFEKALSLEGDNPSTESASIKADQPVEAKEVKAALREGKKVNKATLLVLLAGREYQLTIAASMSTRGIKIPELTATDPVETLVEQASLCTELEDALHDVFLSFMRLRIDPKAWAKERQKIREWILAEEE